MKEGTISKPTSSRPPRKKSEHYISENSSRGFDKSLGDPIMDAEVSKLKLIIQDRDNEINKLKREIHKLKVSLKNLNLAFNNYILKRI